MYSLYSFNHFEYFHPDDWSKAFAAGALPAVCITWTDYCLRRNTLSDFSDFFASLVRNKYYIKGLQAQWLKSSDYTQVFDQFGIDWQGESYSPQEFLSSYSAGTTVLCGFYQKGSGHKFTLAFSSSEHALYIFDPNHGLFKGDAGYSFACQLEYYLLSKYPDIDGSRVVFRNVKRK